MSYRDIVQWSAGEVGAWLTRRGHSELCDIFMEMDIGGDQMLRLTERQLQGLVRSGIQRKRLVRDLRMLQRSLDYSDTSAAVTAARLQGVSADLVEYTHRLVSAGLTMEGVGEVEDMDTALRSAGVENIGHLIKIREMMEQEISSRSSSSSLSETSLASLASVHIISGGDSHSRTFASLVQIYLQLRGLDVTKTEAGFLSSLDTENILDAEAVIVVLQGDYHHDEVLEEEISIAQELDKNIILVVDEHFDLGRVENLFDDSDNVKTIKWIHDYQDAAVDRIVQYIRTEDGDSWSAERCSDKMRCGQKLSVSIDSGIDVCM